MNKLTALTANPASAYSVCPYHSMNRVHEQLSAFFNLCMVAGAGAFGIRGAGSLFGQCLLVSKDNYNQVGGHETVKNRVLENLYLAEAFSRQGIGRVCYLGRETIRMRMYPESLRSLWRGWSKGFLSGASANRRTAAGPVLGLDHRGDDCHGGPAPAASRECLPGLHPRRPAGLRAVCRPVRLELSPGRGLFGLDGGFLSGPASVLIRPCFLRR